MGNKIKTGHLIQRIIVFHLGLLPGAQSSGFDEAASNEEICEHILYYNDFVTEGGERMATADSKCCYHFDEAIRFAGLCSALYSIQTTLDNQMNQSTTTIAPAPESKTKEVYLSTCTLVFIPLETSETNGIVAVAQLQRPTKGKASKTINDKDYFSPAKIRLRLTKAHDIFQHTNGGIHMRLCTEIIQDNQHEQLPKNDYGTSQSSGNGNAYIGMDEFYSHHKSLRKLKQTYQNASTESDKVKVEKEMHLIEWQLSNCAHALPVNALRMDLKQFYDSFLRDIAFSEC